MIGAMITAATQTAALSPPLYVWRCCGCGRILARLYLPPGGKVEIKCKCNALNVREAV